MYRNNKLNQFNLNYLYKNRGRQKDREPGTKWPGVFASRLYDELIPHLVLVFFRVWSHPERTGAERQGAASCNRHAKADCREVVANKRSCFCCRQ